MHGKSVLVWLAFSLLSGCATVSAENNGDPWEQTNRKIFAFNLVLDQYAIKPAARAYRWALPAYVRDRLRAITSNLLEPLIFANNVLQIRPRAAGITLGRFVINSTFGLAGMFDLAQGDGWVQQSGDFGQTLYRWGVGGGPYVVLPFFGPSGVRDAFGLGVDLWGNPVARVNNVSHWGWITFGIGVVRALDLREQNIESLEALQANSLDYYATLRSVYQQRRRAKLQEARPEASPPEEELFDPGATSPGSGTKGNEGHGSESHGSEGQGSESPGKQDQGTGGRSKDTPDGEIPPRP